MAPYKSLAQEHWAHSPSGEKALGEEGVKEWDKATKGKKLPKKAKHPIHEKHDMAEHVSRVTGKYADEE